MYSPKIREELIPVLYKIGKLENKPMTRVVDELLRYAIENREEYKSILDRKYFDMAFTRRLFKNKDYSY